MLRFNQREGRYDSIEPYTTRKQENDDLCQGEWHPN